MARHIQVMAKVQCISNHLRLVYQWKKVYRIHVLQLNVLQKKNPVLEGRGKVIQWRIKKTKKNIL